MGDCVSAACPTNKREAWISTICGVLNIGLVGVGVFAAGVLVPSWREKYMKCGGLSISILLAGTSLFLAAARTKYYVEYLHIIFPILYLICTTVIVLNWILAFRMILQGACEPWHDLDDIPYGTNKPLAPRQYGTYLAQERSVAARA